MVLFCTVLKKAKGDGRYTSLLESYNIAHYSYDKHFDFAKKEKILKKELSSKSKKQPNVFLIIAKVEK